VKSIVKDLKFVSLALLALLFIGVYSSPTVFAKSKKAKYGIIKIMTTPGGLLLTIDGKTHGETLTEYRSFELEPGMHNVVVKLPNGTFMDAGYRSTGRPHQVRGGELSTVASAAEIAVSVPGQCFRAEIRE
jgi:ABC-type Na+ efflux pump permease subunit